jgi:hypothetical protein
MIRFAIVLAIAACSHPANPRPMTPCEDAIEGFLSGDPARLRGLPADCTLPDAFDRLGFSALLGEPGTGYDVHRSKRGKLNARAWLTTSNKLVLVDATEPPVAAYGLGEPDARLDFTWRDVVMPNAEAIYLSRGIAVATDGPRVVRVAIFQPTTLDEYRRSLRFFDISRDTE